MTLPNSYSGTKRKMQKFWEEGQKQKIDIKIYQNTETAVISELGKSRTVQFVNNAVDLSSDFNLVLPNEIDEFTEGVLTAYRVWEVNVSGLLFKEAVGLVHNYVFKFGGSTTILIKNIFPDTSIRTVNYASTDNLTDRRINKMKFYYGVYLVNLPKLQEFDQEFRVKLDLRYISPTLHY